MARARGRWLLLVAALAAVAAVVVVVVVRRDAAPGADGPPDVEVAVPETLIAWLDAGLPEGASVAAPPGLRDDLLGAGADAALLRDPVPEAAGNSATPALVLAETAPEGSRLLARFEREGDAPLLLVDPAPVEPTPDQRRQRETLAAAILTNPGTRTGGNAREVLSAADVDARLLALIGAATAQQGLGLAAFPRLPGEEPGTAPARRVLVDAYGGRPVPDDDAATRRLVSWLDAQLPPFAPATVEVSDEGVLIAFDYAPGPDAVVGEATR
ncbi:hypothetical protein DQ244_00525 [Blastococcus sp. TBT05-19]|uniref:hypothetical protein n=1 Tax=Blastococcus sp. TBT05-19 TaxID=2250581 RepID=UPI000DE85275|nr:hypothetical protein [Blastococcus sp. TBT05-19]RBY93899.1 hypothetical protein DQ244_00525 [Blastococcus sp. TBT05-19]